MVWNVASEASRSWTDRDRLGSGVGCAGHEISCSSRAHLHRVMRRRFRMIAIRLAFLVKRTPAIAERLDSTRPQFGQAHLHTNPTSEFIPNSRAPESRSGKCQYIATCITIVLCHAEDRSCTSGQDYIGKFPAIHWIFYSAALITLDTKSCADRRAPVLLPCLGFSFFNYM